MHVANYGNPYMQSVISKFQQSTTYRRVSNELKIIYNYNTKLTVVKEASNKIQKQYFEFSTKDTLIGRNRK
jgi:protoheme ferro-lyase